MHFFFSFGIVGCRRFVWLRRFSLLSLSQCRKQSGPKADLVHCDYLLLHTDKHI
jgi:hypothetical protein